MAPVTVPRPAEQLTGPELVDLARSLAADPELWRPHVRAQTDRRHCHPLLRLPWATAWLICLMPGQDTGFHDHDGAAGAVAVVEGRVAEARLRLGGPPAHRELGAGEALAFGPAVIHRVAHAAGRPAVTIHAYSPALRRMGAYVAGEDGELQRVAIDEDTELGAPAA